jgi:hypothetical protein
MRLIIVPQLLLYIVPLQLVSPTMTTPVPGPSDKLAQKAQITTTLFLNTTQVPTIKRYLLTILRIFHYIEEYCQELKMLIDLQKELQALQKDNSHYAHYIRTLENDLSIANNIIPIL